MTCQPLAGIKKTVMQVNYKLPILGAVILFVFWCLSNYTAKPNLPEPADSQVDFVSFGKPEPLPLSVGDTVDLDGEVLLVVDVFPELGGVVLSWGDSLENETFYEMGTLTKLSAKW